MHKQGLGARQRASIASWKVVADPQDHTGKRQSTKARKTSGTVLPRLGIADQARSGRQPSRSRHRPLRDLGRRTRTIGISGDSDMYKSSPLML